MKYVVEIPDGAELPKIGYLRNARPLGTCETCQLKRICFGPGPYEPVEEFGEPRKGFCSEYRSDAE